MIRGSHLDGVRVYGTLDYEDELVLFGVELKMEFEPGPEVGHGTVPPLAAAKENLTGGLRSSMQFLVQHNLLVMS